MQRSANHIQLGHQLLLIGNCTASEVYQESKTGKMELPEKADGVLQGKELACHNW